MEIKVGYKLNEDLFKDQSLENDEVSQFDMPQDSWFFRNFGMRHKFFYAEQEGRDKKLDYSFLEVFSIKDLMIIEKKYGIKTPTAKIVDGVYHLDLPTVEERDPKHKHHSKIVLNPNHLVFSYYCQIDEDMDYESEEYDKLSRLPFYATYNVLSRKVEGTDHTISFDRNDMLLNGKKVWGFESTSNLYGIYMIGNTVLNVEEYRKFIEPIFGDDNQHARRSGKSMTGVEDEIEGYTKEEFIEDYKKEISKLVKEAETILNK